MVDTSSSRTTTVIPEETCVPRHRERITTAPLRSLLLGGASEAAEIANRLIGRPGLILISSFAGRTAQPKLPESRVRIGGFGGVDGLIAYLTAEKIDLVIDATHPFAARISANAEAACSNLSLPLIAYDRPPWERSEDDRWHEVPSMEGAAACVAQRSGRIFLAIGRQQVDLFSSCTEASLLIRAIDPPASPLPSNAQLILERGPFDLEHELNLLREHAIDLIVSKNSGGPSTYAKIEAARILGIPVVMVSRPQKRIVPAFATIDSVLAEIGRLQGESAR